jgi:glucosamine-6-phosphate deaminase
MNIIIAKDYEELSRIAADYVIDFINKKPNANICFPTGNTPLGMYKNITEKTDPSEWKETSIVCLDEYAGIGEDDRKSLFRWLKQELVNPLQIKKTYYVDALANDLDEECASFEEKLEAIGGLDLTVLGLGMNGHIGFNEPGSSPESKTRVLPLTKASLESNAVYWNVDMTQVPKEGITLGIGTILESEHIILIVSGEKKAEVLKKVVDEAETDQVPASFLKRASNFTIITDEAAAKLLV